MVGHSFGSARTFALTCQTFGLQKVATVDSSCPRQLCWWSFRQLPVVGGFWWCRQLLLWIVGPTKCRLLSDFFLSLSHLSHQHICSTTTPVASATIKHWYHVINVDVGDSQGLLPVSWCDLEDTLSQQSSAERSALNELDLLCWHCKQWRLCKHLQTEARRHTDFA